MNDQEKAKQDYMAGMKYKDIAEKYGVTVNTVKSWRKRHGWSRTQNKGAPTKGKGVHPKPEKGAPTKEGAESELTPQQELFAQLVGGKRIPLYRAYQTAYVGNKPSLATAYVNASKLAKEPKVALRITKISESTAAEYDWSIPKVVDELTFVHDESKADMIANGVKKANADAMLQSVNSITDVLGLKASDREQIRRLKAEADLAAMRVTAANVNTNGQMESIDKLLNTIVQGSEQHDD